MRDGPGALPVSCQQFIEALGATSLVWDASPAMLLEWSTRHDIIYDAHIGCPQLDIRCGQPLASGAVMSAATWTPILSKKKSPRQTELLKGHQWITTAAQWSPCLIIVFDVFFILFYFILFCLFMLFIIYLLFIIIFIWLLVSNYYVIQCQWSLIKLT